MKIIEGPPPPDDHDTPTDFVQEKVPPSMPAGLPMREDVAKWVGYLAETAEQAVTVGRLVSDKVKESYIKGISVCQAGGRITKPADICDTDARRYKRLLAGEPQSKQRKPLELPVVISKLIRRPVDSRATFDLSIEYHNRCATLTHLDGATLGSYSRIRDLAIEHCIPLPAVNRPAKDAWDGLLETAFNSVIEVHVESEESALLAIKEEISCILLDSEIGESGQDLKRGMVAQDEEGKHIYILPKSLVSRIRARLDADKPTREQVTDAARMLGMTPTRPTLSDGNRPRVWAFDADGVQRGQNDDQAF